MVQFDGLRPARLKVGIISAGRVGTALGVALERADHVVVACSAISHASRQRAQRRLPDTPLLSPPDVARAPTSAPRQSSNRVASDAEKFITSLPAASHAGPRIAIR